MSGRVPHASALAEGTQSTSMKRAKTWASGRKRRVEATVGASTSVSFFGQAFSARSRKLPCVSSQPLGRPVVPDV